MLTIMDGKIAEKNITMKNIDLSGNEVKTGDIMLEPNKGFGYLHGSEYIYPLRLWEVPEIKDGRGHYYSIEGKKTYYMWVNIGSAIKVDMSLMPTGFEYSFKHGMRDFATKIEYGTVLDLIESSNWKDCEVKKEQVDRYEFMKTLKIETLDDLKNNIDELMIDGYVPHEIITNVLDVAGIGRAFPFNGEVGIAKMHDQMNYERIIKEMLRKKNND